MTTKNTWYIDQKRKTENGGKKGSSFSDSFYAPKWNKDTVIWIMEQIKSMAEFTNIQYQLMTQYKVTALTASYWIEMTRRIIKDMTTGTSLDDAIENDRVYRNLKRRKKV